MKSTNFNQITLALKTCNEELYKTCLTDSVDYGIAYLISRYSADNDFAYDCVMAVIERMLVRFDSLCGNSNIHFSSYFIEACKNQYLSERRKLKSTDPLSNSYDINDATANIYDILYSKEQKEFLRRCLNKLNDHQFEFIAWLFQHAGAENTALEGHFSLPINAIYQKKHRIVKLLQKCVSLFT